MPVEPRVAPQRRPRVAPSSASRVELQRRLRPTSAGPRSTVPASRTAAPAPVGRQHPHGVRVARPARPRRRRRARRRSAAPRAARAGRGRRRRAVPRAGAGRARAPGARRAGAAAHGQRRATAARPLAQVDQPRPAPATRGRRAGGRRRRPRGGCGAEDGRAGGVGVVVAEQVARDPVGHPQGARQQRPIGVLDDQQAAGDQRRPGGHPEPRGGRRAGRHAAQRAAPARPRRRRRVTSSLR